MQEDWTHVAETVKQRRAELGLSQRAAADAAGLSPTTWGSLETHRQRIEILSRPKFARALRWTPDSIDRILAGDDPQEAEPEPVVTLEDRMGALEVEVAALRATFLEVLERIRPPAP